MNDSKVAPSAEDTIEPIVDKMFLIKRHANHRGCQGGQNRFNGAFKVATRDCHFIFDGKLYKEADRVTTGS